MKVKLKIRFFVVKSDNTTEEVSTLRYGVYDSFVAASRAYQSFSKMMAGKQNRTPSHELVFHTVIFESFIERAPQEMPDQEGKLPF